MEPNDPFPAPSQAPTSLAARLFNVFAEPGNVFTEVKTSSPAASNWLVPMVCAAVAGMLSIFILFSQPAIVQQIHEQQTKAFDDQVKAGKMTQAQADQAEAIAEKFAGPTGIKIFGSISAVVFSFVQVFWWALVLWLLGLLFLKVKFPYSKALEVAGLATMISVLGTIVTLLISVTLGKAINPSLAFFLKDFDPKNIVHLALAAVDLFSLWLTAVMAVGLSRLAGVTFSRALVGTAGYWLAFQLFVIALKLSAVHLGTAAQ